MEFTCPGTVVTAMGTDLEARMACFVTFLKSLMLKFSKKFGW